MINPAVGVWLAVSFAGLLVSLYLTHESRLDLAALGTRANGRRLVARSRMLREGIRVTVHGGYVLAGLAGLGILPREIIVPCLIYGNLALLINSLIDWRARGPILETRHGEPPMHRDSTS